jgi:hypothetical protein
VPYSLILLPSRRHIRFPSLGATILTDLFLLLIPKPTPIGGPRTQIPRLDETIPGSIDVAFRLEFLDADAQTAFFGEGDVFGFQLGGGSRGDLQRAEVEVVADEGEGAEGEEEDQEGDAFAVGLRSVSWSWEKGGRKEGERGERRERRGEERKGKESWTNTRTERGGGGGFGVDRPQAMIVEWVLRLRICVPREDGQEEPKVIRDRVL